jgi:hypothetical protein
MPVIELPADTMFDGSSKESPPSGTKVTTLPKGTTLDPKEPPASSGAFYGAAHLLPQSVQKLLPGFMTGPSAIEQIGAEGQKAAAETKRLGRPLKLRERLEAEPATSSPVAMGFATHQLGGDVPVPKIGTAGRAEFARAAKPAVGSIRAAGGREPYYDKAERAIQVINENREHLHFTDADGNIVTGERPESLDQFDDAIGQAKQQVFKKYNPMAQQAGMIGPPVDLRPIASELNKIATDPVQIFSHPEVANYAAKRADDVMKQGQFYADDAQRVVQSMNGTLKSLYSSGTPPTYDLIARANIDALIANRLRVGIDNVIEQSVGPGYQDLKNDYGALKTIENDVRRQSAVRSRQESGGGILGRIVDVASAEQVLHGLATFSPERVATGAFLKMWQQFVKHRRDPNTAVKNLFKRASTPVVDPSPASPVVPYTPGSQDKQGLHAADPYQ